MNLSTGKLTLTDNVYNGLLTRISNGTYSIGAKLPSESELCKIYGVSRVCIRGALQRLEAMGIIEIIHGKGSYVKGTDTSGEHQPIDIAEISRDHLLSPPDYEEFWRFRYTIESEAFNLFASRATDADFQALDDLVRKIIDSSTQEELEEATYEYQTYIYTHCGNRYIANSMMIHESVLRASIHTIQVQRNQSRGMVAQWRISVTNFLRNKDAVSAINILAKENILHLQNPKQP